VGIIVDGGATGVESDLIAREWGKLFFAAGQGVEKEKGREGSVVGLRGKE